MCIDMEKLRLEINDLLYAVKFIFKEDSFKDLQESLELVLLSYFFPSTYKMDYRHIEKIKALIENISIYELEHDKILMLENNIDELKKFFQTIEDEL